MDRNHSLWQRHKGRCHYCDVAVVPSNGEPHKHNHATRDHLITRSNGGTDGMYNLVLSCYLCNWLRDDMEYHAFVASLPELLKRRALDILIMETGRPGPKCRARRKVKRDKVRRHNEHNQRRST